MPELTIERQILIHAPRQRVWTAIATAAEFAQWFRLKIDGEFRPGARVHVESTYPGHEGVRFHLDIVQMEEPSVFAFGWDHPDEPAPVTTTVTFTLQETAEGTVVTVRESGLENISEAKRAAIFERNSEGWRIQSENIRQHVEKAA